MTNDALRTLLPIASWREEHARAVEITGGTDPILPTPFRIGETSAAALAAVGLAVADLWELRTGRRQEVAVDTRQATASLRSGRYMQMDGAPVSTERNTVMGVYPAKNGRWSYLHCNFPNHRAAALSVLGVPEDFFDGIGKGAIDLAVGTWHKIEQFGEDFWKFITTGTFDASVDFGPGMSWESDSDQPIWPRKDSDVSSVPPSRMLPVTVAPTVPASPRTARVVMDLPDPLSPARPRISPSARASSSIATTRCCPKRTSSPLIASLIG